MQKKRPYFLTNIVNAYNVTFKDTQTMSVSKTTTIYGVVFYKENDFYYYVSKLVQIIPTKKASAD